VWHAIICQQEISTSGLLWASNIPGWKQRAAGNIGKADDFESPVLQEIAKEVTAEIHVVDNDRPKFLLHSPHPDVANS